MANTLVVVITVMAILCAYPGYWLFVVVEKQTRRGGNGCIFDGIKLLLLLHATRRAVEIDSDLGN